MIELIAVGLLLMFLGAIVGAELQGHVHEEQRRRMAARTRDLNAAWAELREHPLARGPHLPTVHSAEMTNGRTRRQAPERGYPRGRFDHEGR